MDIETTPTALRALHVALTSDFRQAGLRGFGDLGAPHLRYSARSLFAAALAVCVSGRGALGENY